MACLCLAGRVSRLAAWYVWMEQGEHNGGGIDRHALNAAYAGQQDARDLYLAHADWD